MYLMTTRKTSRQTVTFTVKTSTGYGTRTCEVAASAADMYETMWKAAGHEVTRH